MLRSYFAISHRVLRKTFLPAGMTAMIVLAACSKKEEPLPPPPPKQEQPVYTPPSVVTPTAVPGSLEDLIATVGADRVFFAYDSYALRPEATSVLTRLAQWLMKYPGKRYVIEGHCDERGTREYNLALGARRASAVKNFLVARGIRPGDLRTISYGKERPEQLGSDERSYALNRRGVIVIQ